MREYCELEFLGLNFIRKLKIDKQVELVKQDKPITYKKANKEIL